MSSLRPYRTRSFSGGTTQVVSGLLATGLIAVLLVSGGIPLGGQASADCPEAFGPTARCAWMAVPENREDPSGRTIRLRVVVLPATSGTVNEPVVWFPGGPGQAATDLIPLATQVYGSARATRDFVFIGQRGTGESNPLHCTLDVAGDPHLAFGALLSPARIGSCYSEALEHADPVYYNTPEYIRDVADVLTKLGYERAVLWGGSGGTRTAQAFFRDYPERVVAVAMDGIAPIDFRMPLPFARSTQTAWDRVVEDCGKQPACNAAFPGLDDSLVSLFDLFEDGPVSTQVQPPSGGEVTVSMHRGDLSYAIRGILYNAGATANLPREVHQAARSGDLGFFAQSHFNRSVALRGTVLAMGYHLSAFCAEDVPRVDPSAVAGATSGSFMGTYLIEQYGAACDAWKTAPLEADWFRPLRSDVPALLVSGWYDPSTPPEAAEIVREGLPNSVHIVVRNVGHGAGFGCAQPAVLQFLANGSLDGVRNPCPDEPILFEVEPS